MLQMGLCKYEIQIVSLFLVAVYTHRFVTNNPGIIRALYPYTPQMENDLKCINPMDVSNLD